MIARSIASLPDAKRKAKLDELSPAAKAIARYTWAHWAREKQLPPAGDWTVWLVLAGRGFGKTRTGAEWFRAEAEQRPNGTGELLAMTPADARDVMITGPAGILSVCPPWNRPDYEPSIGALTWPNGFKALIRSAHNPEKVRGPEPEVAWADELAAWPSKKGREAWDNLMFGLRAGEKPRVAVTTTPKPIPLLRELMKADGTVVTTGSTYENRDNLAPSFFETILKKYEGSTLGRQEIYAEMLDEIEGALWKHALIEKHRIAADAELPELERVVVGVDPSGGVVETGIVVVGVTKDRHVYVLEDATLRDTPQRWGSVVIAQYEKWKSDIVAGEKNYGGDMVRSTVETAARDMGAAVRYKHVLASRGKTIRAEPVVALYEQGRVHHRGTWPALEAEMTTWVPGEPSPNRIDALVWAVTELAVDELKPVRQVPVQWG